MYNTISDLVAQIEDSNIDAHKKYDLEYCAKIDKNYMTSIRFMEKTLRDIKRSSEFIYDIDDTNSSIKSEVLNYIDLLGDIEEAYRHTVYNVDIHKKYNMTYGQLYRSKLGDVLSVIRTMIYAYKHAYEYIIKTKKESEFKLNTSFKHIDF